MGLSDHMSENVSNNGQHDTWGARSPPAGQWEPDHEPPLDGKPDPSDASCAGPRADASKASLPSSLAPLSHHTQLTRFLSKQNLGYIPKLNLSPERATSPPGVLGGLPREGGAFSFDSPRGASTSIRLPSLTGTPPLSPQKWPSSSFSNQDDGQPEGRPSLPAFNAFPQRAGSFSESCASPIPPLKRPHLETSHHTMSIADLCQPLKYMRSQSCPSDTMPNANPEPSPVGATSPESNWRPSLEPQTYVRTQSCFSEADSFVARPPVSGPVSLEEELQRSQLQRSNSMDARTLNAHKRSAATAIDLHQWLDRPNRSSLSSLADSADTMQQLEQAGRCMRISDSPREDVVTPHEAKREKKLCAFPQCTSNAVTRGLCISHGGGRRCQRKGCTRGAQSKGLCVAHGGGRICRAEGCSNIQRSMGLCIRHGGGRRCRIKGCQKGVVRQDLCTAHGGKRKCRVPDCTKHVKKKGLCRSHANSMYAASGSS